MRLKRWQSFTEWPLAAAAVAFLVAYSWSVIANLTAPEDFVAELTMNIVWLLFVVDYGVQLILAPRRWHWFVRNLPQLAVVALPVLRPLRLLRLISLVRVLDKTLGSAFRGRITLYLIGGASLLVFVAGLAVLDAEQNHGGANITNFGDALWWAFVTITTVGYGDFYPVTLTGRLIAAGLMVSGIALLGTVTATLASWFIELIRKRDLTEDDSGSSSQGPVQ